jgi:hypothetical protein
LDPNNDRANERTGKWIEDEDLKLKEENSVGIDEERQSSTRSLPSVLYGKDAVRLKI